jgi:hypothetical protein
MHAAPVERYRLPIEDEAIARIVDAVRREPRSRALLSDHLAQVHFEYRARRTVDIAPTRSERVRELEGLSKAVETFKCALDRYNEQRRPGWEFVESAAQVNLEGLLSRKKGF